ncbi:IS3 family transposase, partial [uncultured Pantoea sp.]|uniref:IS3 family transposase n=1 Tax=uncultured Pantoea sp. TaxID=218084 RepID=UPI00258FB8C1
AESFFSSLKKERIRKRIYKTRDLARADIFGYIEVFYNRARRHVQSPWGTRGWRIFFDFFAFSTLI